MASSASFRRLLLQGIFWDSLDKGLSLFEALKTACRSSLKSTESGNFLIGTTSNGKNAQFEIPASGRGSSPQEIAEDLQSLYDLYEVSKACLISGGTVSPTDEQILVEMKRRIRPVRSFSLDHSGLRIGRSAIDQEVTLA